MTAPLARYRTLIGATSGLMLFFSMSPAYTSSCHKYSVWHYPWPQRCRVPVPLVHRAAEQSHDWYVEFVFPDDDPDIVRAKAIDELRAKLK
jgi:hypothetical protein